MIFCHVLDFLSNLNLILHLPFFKDTTEPDQFNSSITVIFPPKNVYIRKIIKRKLKNIIFLTFIRTGSSSTSCLEKANSWKDCFWHTKPVFLIVDYNIWAPTWNSFICMYWDTWSKYSLIYIFQIFQMGCTAPVWTLSCSHSWISERILFFLLPC